MTSSGSVSEYSLISEAASDASNPGSEIGVERDSCAGTTSSCMKGSLASNNGSANCAAIGTTGSEIIPEGALTSAGAAGADRSKRGSAGGRTEICSVVSGRSANWWIAATGSTVSDSPGWMGSNAISGSRISRVTDTGRGFSVIAPGAMKTHLS